MCDEKESKVKPRDSQHEGLGVLNLNVSEFVPRNPNSMIPPSHDTIGNTWIHVDVHPAHAPLDVPAMLDSIPSPSEDIALRFVSSASNALVTANVPFSSHVFNPNTQEDTFEKFWQNMNLNLVCLMETR